MIVSFYLWKVVGESTDHSYYYHHL
jgi:hypothetical protein